MSGSHVCKICLLGDGSVGKTALRGRFMGKAFTGRYIMTIGADFAIKTINVGKNNIKFQIWDLAGQPRFGVVRSLYYRGSMGALLVFDVTRRDSFDNISSWVNELWDNNGKKKVPMVLIGNKIDLRTTFPEGITEQDGQNLAKNLSERCSDAGFCVEYVETSAKTNENVTRSFSLLGENILSFMDSYTSQ
ncbi:MAG: GTP-binding protein [Candidatus Hodarchaeales archaeon]|jgi:Ras-related protein Rab-1A